MSKRLTEEQEIILEESTLILSGEKKFQEPPTTGKGYSSRYIEVPWEASQLHKGDSVLDIGFSLSSLETLGMLLAAKDMGFISLEAVDIINPEKVSRRYPEEWLKNIYSVPVSVGDVRTLELPKERFDAVTCISTIEHIGYDLPSTTVPGSSFERKTAITDLQTTRDPRVNTDVLTFFHSVLKPGGRALLSVPMGKGGPIVLKDSLGLYCVEWEYEENTWEELTHDERFTLASELFYKNTPRGWVAVASPKELSDVTETMDAQGVGLALCVLVKNKA